MSGQRVLYYHHLAPASQPYQRWNGSTFSHHKSGVGSTSKSSGGADETKESNNFPQQDHHGTRNKEDGGEHQKSEFAMIDTSFGAIIGSVASPSGPVTKCCLFQESSEVHTAGERKRRMIGQEILCKHPHQSADATLGQSLANNIKAWETVKQAKQRILEVLADSKQGIRLADTDTIAADDGTTPPSKCASSLQSQPGNGMNCKVGNTLSLQSEVSTDKLLPTDDEEKISNDVTAKITRQPRGRGEKKSAFAIAISESYFIPGITGRARCLSDTSAPLLSDKAFVEPRLATMIGTQKLTQYERSVSVSSFSSTNSWDIQRHSSGSWCPEDSRSIWADSFALSQDLFVSTSLVTVRPHSRRKAHSTKLPTTRNSLDTFLEGHNPANHTRERNRRDWCGSVYCRAEEKKRHRDVDGKSKHGADSNINIAESLQKELDIIRTLLCMHKERKSAGGKASRTTNPLPTLNNSHPTMMLLPPSVERKSLHSMLSHKSTRSNNVRPTASPSLLATPCRRATLSSPSLSLSTAGRTQRPYTSADIASPDNMRPTTSLSPLSSPRRATLSSRSLGCCSTKRRTQHSCKSTDIDSASPHSGLQAVTLENSELVSAIGGIQ